YKIEGMTCGSCVRAVKKSVCKLPGINKCEVEVGSLTLDFTPGQGPSEADIEKAVKAAGYMLVK
ncbi:MAG: heavy-metal-associated domain-containing protein, partial [Bdellovibrionaceae bacterium]|nr:heavy-metal-associated domain-containing protein [Pseudobdellovibrionaceae bacterium]